MPWFWKSSEQAKQPLEKPKDEAAAPFDPKKLPAPEKLPKRLQKIVDADDGHVEDAGFFSNVKAGLAKDSTESNVRYAAYATRIRTILLSAHRYVAYTSDIGESFRPVAHPNIVRAAYGISWLYILGDVSHEGYRSYWRNQRVLNPGLQLTPYQQKVSGLPAVEVDVDAGAGAVADAQTARAAPGTVPPLEDYRTVMVQRAIFQSVASMGLPAFTIHSVVRYSGRALKNAKSVALRTWGPIGLGLSVVPFLPSLFDKPVENAVEWAFHRGFEAFGGHEYVGDSPATGREKLLNKVPKKSKEE